MPKPNPVQKTKRIIPRGKETNLTVKETISTAKMPNLKKKLAPVSSDTSTNILRTALGLLMPDQAAQFLSAITTKDNKLGVKDLTPDIKQALFTSVKNAKKRTGKATGGTQYIDFGPEAEQAFQGMTAGPSKMISTDPAIQAAAMLGRVSYKTNESGETEIYDSYDFSKTDPNKADSMYKKIRAYAGVALPDEGNKANLIGRIPSGQYANGTGEEGIDPPIRSAYENELMSRVITERNKDKNFVQRALNPNDYPSIINEDGSETTHLMQYSTDSNGNAFVSPSVIQNELGLLSKLTPREGAQYGRKTGEEIMIPDVQLAEYYTANGLIKHGYGTNSQGIMKTRMNPRKKYNSGTGITGIDFPVEGIDPPVSIQDTVKTSTVPPALQMRLDRQKANRDRIQARLQADATKFGFESIEDYQKWQVKRNKGKDQTAYGAYGIADPVKEKEGPGFFDVIGQIFTEKPGCIFTDEDKSGVKKANGTGAKGIGPSNYIQTPNQALNDYNIMLANVEKEVANNKLVPIVSMAGSLIQQGIGMSGSFAKQQSGIKPGSEEALDKVLDVDPNKIIMTGANGTVAANGMNNVQADVEVEGGEMYETPQGDVGEFKGPSHEQGGIPLEVGQDVEEGTKVYSDRLKLGNKTLAERKEARERKIANLEKIASQPLVDTAVKNATKRRMMSIQKEESADLQFQEQVNNMQQMADTMVAAFGTGMTGIQDNPIGDTMEYGYGSSNRGVMKYAGGGEIGDPNWRFYNYDANGNYTGPALPQPGTVNPGDRLLNANNALEAYLNSDAHKQAGSTLDSMINKTVADTASMATGKMPVAGNPAVASVVSSAVSNTPSITGTEIDITPQTNSPFNWSNMNAIPDMVMSGKAGIEQATLDAQEDQAFYTPGQVGTPKAVTTSASTVTVPTNSASKTSVPKVNLPGTRFSRTMGKVGEKLGAANEAGMIPGVGDLTKMFGNYLGMTAGIKTANEQRASDITHTNVFKNAGKESQKMLDNAKQGIQTSKAQAIVKATDVGRGGKRGARNSARGVNQMRGMDWLYDTALQSQIAEISANAAQQLSGIDVQKSGVAMNADQMRGQGEYQANMANEAAKDAYYTALGMGRKDYATGMQQSGKDLNAIKQNKIIENLMKQYGTYVTADGKGKLSNKTQLT
jgi:hypothetical protein